MQQPLLLLAAIVLMLRVSAQQGPSMMPAPPTANGQIFSFVEQMPEFPGGDNELMKFIGANVKYPNMERDNDIQGKVIVRFVVDEEGKVTDATVLRGVSPGLDKEALRVVNMLPNFKPGKQQGKPVKVYYNLPLVFKLTDDKPKEVGADYAAQLQLKQMEDADFKSGVMYTADANYKTALKYFRKSLAKKNDPITHATMAAVYQRMGDKKNACKSATLAEKGGIEIVKDLGFKCK